MTREDNDPVSKPEPALSLIAAYDGIVCDLDGVVYRGHEAVPHAVESLLSAISTGVAVVYATNNASRPPAQVSAHLAELGLPGPVWRVVTSAQAGAQHVAGQLPAGSRVLAVGGPGVALALEEAGLSPVKADAIGDGVPVAAVLQGYGADVAWTDLAEVAYAVQAGALWVVTNVDSTVPTDRGVAPGNGALVNAVRGAVSVEPVVVGKPYTPLYQLSASVLGTTIGRTLAIGDRLDTDIRGATGAGMDSLFVLGGVHDWVDVAIAEQASRPRYLATDLRSLHRAYVECAYVECACVEQVLDVEQVQDTALAARWVCGGAQAWVSAAGELCLSPGGDLNERLRVAVNACWHAADVRGGPVDPRRGDGAALSRELAMAVGDSSSTVVATAAGTTGAGHGQ